MTDGENLRNDRNTSNGGNPRDDGNMSNGGNPRNDGTLRDIIAGEISEKGPMTFRRYMELCLYHPAWGYYNRRDPVIGRAGDFYTSPQVGAVFGRTLARQVEEVWDLAGQPDEFWVVEYGAGTGAMAADIITALAPGGGANAGAAGGPSSGEPTASGSSASELAPHLRYLIVETSPARREEQAATIGAATEASGVRVPVAWAPDLGPIAGAAACVLANELVDAFPVHVVRGESNGQASGERGAGHGLQELYVNTVAMAPAADGTPAFTFAPGAPSTADLQSYLDWLGVRLVDGQAAEVNLEALRWVESLDRGLTRGAVIIIDYGYLSPSLYNPEFRFDGTLMTYRRHKADPNPFLAPGEQDITAHVNFSALTKRAGELGWSVAGYSDQLHFLVNLGILDLAAPSEMGAVKHLVLPGGMGERFKVLALGKGLGAVGASGRTGQPPLLKGFHGPLPGKAD